MTLVLDTGAFLAVEHGDRDTIALIKRACLDARPPTTHGGVVGQVWRGGGKQAAVARLFPGVTVKPLDEAFGRRAGVLLGAAGMSDVVDAAVVLLASDGDTILTSDPEDIARLAAAADLHVDVVRV